MVPDQKRVLGTRPAVIGKHSDAPVDDEQPDVRRRHYPDPHARIQLAIHRPAMSRIRDVGWRADGADIYPAFRCSDLRLDGRIGTGAPQQVGPRVEPGYFRASAAHQLLDPHGRRVETRNPVDQRLGGLGGGQNLLVE